jgi:DNA-binding GntR family transcriptional regulator
LEDLTLAMKALSVAPNLVEQVRDAILAEITSGQLAPGERIIQEQIAQALGVSRQPVQLALVLLRNVGVLQEAAGRGLIVAPLDPDQVQHMYELRSVIEGLACRRAAESNVERAAKQGPALIDAGRKAVASGAVAKMVAADLRFHEFIYGLCGNPLVASVMATHWAHAQRAMGEVLRRDEAPRDVWDEHERILQAIVAGEGEAAERLARAHIMQASNHMVGQLRLRAATREAEVATPSKRAALAHRGQGPRH